MLRERILLPGRILAEFFKLTATVLLRTLSRIERIGNRLDLLYLRPQFGLNFLDDLQPTVDTGG